MTCDKCKKHKPQIDYKCKKYCTWYCAKKGQFMIELTCKKCDDVTIKSDEDRVAVTCSMCSMIDVEVA